MSDDGWEGNANGTSKDAIVVRTDYEWSATAPNTAIVDAIAAAEGAEPHALATDEDTRLFKHIDPDILDALVMDLEKNGLPMRLRIDGYTVRITDTDLIVEPPDPSDSGDI